MSGYDATGNPVKKRVVRSFANEADAKSYADAMAKQGVLAEHVRMLNMETSARIKRLPSTPNSQVSVYKPFTINPDIAGNPQRLAEGAPVVVENASKFAVGNFAKTFDSKAEAKAFADMVNTPEVITGPAPEPTSVRLSAGSISEMETDLRERLGFSTHGSPYQFASAAMVALARGVDVHKRSLQVATGQDWYNMLIHNKVSKQEMRVTGLAQMLYSMRGVKLSRDEVADYVAAMYPTMGRRAITGSPLGLSNKTAYRYPITFNPYDVSRHESLTYLAMLDANFAKLDAAIESADEAGKTQLRQFQETLKAKHLAAMKSSLEMFAGKELADNMQTYEQMRRSIDLNLGEAGGAKSAVLEMYRNTFNDSMRSSNQEQLNALAGLDFA